MAAPLPAFQDLRIAVIGLGYVGLPLAVAFGRRYPTIGFDIDPVRIADLRGHRDAGGELSAEQLRNVAQLHYTDQRAALADCNVFIVTVPTPIDVFKRPDLRPLESASGTVGRAITRGGVVIYESTVYPGATEEVCIPLVEQASGLVCNRDFSAGYSPERINPGDNEHQLENILKLTSGSSPEAADFVDALYRGIIVAGTHKTSSIRVAEAAKVIENTQRDLNIALVNELALIFHRLGLDTHEVLEAAGTKWNFLPFRPGLVGGHCIGVDPYYLTHKAQEIGYHPEVILAGRRINDGMGGHVARRVVKLMQQRGSAAPVPRVLVLGLAFKENCPDLRNTRVIDIVTELQEYNAIVDVHDPLVSPEDALAEHGIKLVTTPESGIYDALIIAVAHDDFVALGETGIRAFGKPGAVLFDVKRALPRASIDGCL